jgi:hypothetical protein
MALVSPITLAQAIANGQPFWDCFLTNWGNTGVGGDPSLGSVRFPLAGQLPIAGITGVAIGERSRVCSTYVRYFAPGIPEANWPKAVVSQDTPLLVSVPGPMVFTVDPTGQAAEDGTFTNDQSPLIESLFSDSLLRIGSTANSAFGTSIADVGKLQPWVDPFLHLRLFLDPSKTPLATAKRAPFADSFTHVFPTAGSAETLLRVWPIAGRRRVRITFRGDSGIAVGVHNLRVSGAQTKLFIGAQPTAVEFALTGGTATVNFATGQVATFNFSDLNCEYLLFYSDGTAVAGSQASCVMESWD